MPATEMALVLADRTFSRKTGWCVAGVGDCSRLGHDKNLGSLTYGLQFSAMKARESSKTRFPSLAVQQAVFEEAYWESLELAHRLVGALRLAVAVSSLPDARPTVDHVPVVFDVCGTRRYHAWQPGKCQTSGAVCAKALRNGQHLGDLHPGVLERSVCKKPVNVWQEALPTSKPHARLRVPLCTGPRPLET